MLLRRHRRTDFILPAGEIRFQQIVYWPDQHILVERRHGLRYMRGMTRQRSPEQNLRRSLGKSCAARRPVCVANGGYPHVPGRRTRQVLFPENKARDRWRCLNSIP